MDSGRLNGKRETGAAADVPPGELLAAAGSLPVRLTEFADGLPDAEKRILTALFVAAMSPLERMRFLDPSGLLTSDELRALGGLPPPRE